MWEVGSSLTWLVGLSLKKKTEYFIGIKGLSEYSRFRPDS